MIVRALAVALLLVTAVVLQTAVFPTLTFAGFRPDLLLLVTVAFALRDGAISGVRVGFASGLLTDLLLHGSAIGLNALVLVVVGYIVGVARPYLAMDSITAPLTFALLASVVATASYGILARLLGQQPLTLVAVVQASLFVAVYNTLLMPLVAPVVNRISRIFPLERYA